MAISPMSKPNPIMRIGAARYDFIRPLSLPNYPDFQLETSSTNHFPMVVCRFVSLESHKPVKDNGVPHRSSAASFRCWSTESVHEPAIFDRRRVAPRPTQAPAKNVKQHGI